jgi:hypothetical protein
MTYSETYTSTHYRVSCQILTWVELIMCLPIGIFFEEMAEWLIEMILKLFQPNLISLSTGDSSNH